MFFHGANAGSNPADVLHSQCLKAFLFDERHESSAQELLRPLHAPIGLLGSHNALTFRTASVRLFDNEQSENPCADPIESYVLN